MVMGDSDGTGTPTHPARLASSSPPPPPPPTSVVINRPVVSNSPPPLLSPRPREIGSNPILSNNTHRHPFAPCCRGRPPRRAKNTRGIPEPPTQAATKTDSFSLLDPSRSQACARILCLPRPGELLPPPPPLPSVSSFSNPSLFPLYHHQSIYWFRRDMWW